MSRIKTAFRFFNNNLLLNIFIVAQLTVAIFLVNSIFVLLINLNYAKVITKDLYKENFLIITNIDKDKEYGNFLHMKEKYQNEVQVGEVNNIITSINNKKTRLLGYSDTILKYIQLPLAEGRWYNEEPKENDYINIVATDDLGRIGDILTYELSSNNYKFKITGILPQSYPYIGFASSIYSLDDFFDWNTPSNYISMVMCDFKEYPEQAWRGNAFVVINNNLSENQKTDIKEAFSSVGLVHDKEAFIESCKEENQNKIGVYIPMIIIFLVVGMLNFILIIILLVTKNLRDIAIMYLCGANKANVLKIMTIFCLIICFFAVVMTSILTNVIGISFMSSGIITNKYITLAIIGGMIGIFIVLTVTFSLICIKQKDISMILKS